MNWARGATPIFPKDCRIELVAAKASRAAVIEKPYQALDSVEPPQLIISTEDAVSSHPLGDDPRPASEVSASRRDEFRFRGEHDGLPAGSRAEHGRNARDGARAHHARRRRNLPAWAIRGIR